MKKESILFFLLFLSVKGFGQYSQSDSVNRRLLYKNHLGAQLGGPSFLSINYEHFFNQNWSIEMGAGSVLVLSGIHVGGRYYVGKQANPTKFSPYLGISLGAASIIGGGSSGGIGGYGTAVGYVPLGIQLMNKNGSTFSIEVAGMYLDNEFFPMGAIRLYKPLEAGTRQKRKSERESVPKIAADKKSVSYQLGLNVGALVKPGLFLNGTPDFYFSSNANVDFFIQKEISNKYAFRLPIRIGFNNKYNWQSKVNEVLYRMGNKQIIGDIGIEPLKYFYRRNKSVGYLVGTLVGGVGRNISKEYLGNQWGGDYQYQSTGGTYPYVKFGCSIGGRWKVTPSIHLALEYGFYLANNVHYQGPDSYGGFYKGLSGKYLLVYQLGKRN